MIGEVETESNINEEIIEKWKSFQFCWNELYNFLSQRIRLKLHGYMLEQSTCGKN